MDLKQPPVCVDLDGTLLNTNLLVESLVKLSKKNLINLLRFLIWRMKGKAYLKKKVAELAPINCEILPYNQKVLQFIENMKDKVPLVLATGADIDYAKQIAGHLGCFDQVFASDGTVNLTGKKKRNLLLRAFGEKGFSYIGNSRDDVPIWKVSQAAFFVNASRQVQNKIRGFSISTCILDQHRISWRIWAKQLRVHQWIKNILLFVPLITSHRFDSIFQILIAFVSFSFISSAIYIVNDLCDLEADRQHPTKKNRPLASGDLPIGAGLGLAALLVPLSFYLSSFLSPHFTTVILAYVGINVVYNTILKTKPLLDVLCLSALYLLRVLGGHAVTGVPFSSWLTTFALFFFLSLALIKRFTECRTKQSVIGRGYGINDAMYLSVLGLTSSAISILVFTLYLSSEQVTKMYSSPEYLWFFIPLFFYWINRLWLKAFRHEMDDDPVVFALKDRVSHCIVGILVLIVFFACYF